MIRDSAILVTFMVPEVLLKMRLFPLSGIDDHLAAVIRQGVHVVHFLVRPSKRLVHTVSHLLCQLSGSSKSMTLSMSSII